MSNTLAETRCPAWTSGRSRATLLVPSWLRGRRAVALVTLAAVGAGLVLGWPSLVALGVAPVLVSLLPCAAMCALGVCMMGPGNRSCHKSSASESAPGSSPVPATVSARNPGGDV